MPLMMSSVEVAPAFTMVSSTALAAVDVNDVGLRRAAVMHIGDVAHVDDGAVDGLDRQIVEGVDRRRRVVQVDGVFVACRSSAVPTGVIRFCSDSALMTSLAETPY